MRKMVVGGDGFNQLVTKEVLDIINASTSVLFFLFFNRFFFEKCNDLQR